MTTQRDTNTDRRLFDADTGDDLGPATVAQIAASKASRRGIVAINRDGDVLVPGTFVARHAVEIGGVQWVRVA